MKTLEEAYSKVIESEIFKEWIKEHDKAYLCSFFRMVGEEESKGWQVDFYNSKDDTITSFLDDDGIKKISEGSKVFKAAKDRLGKLDLGKIKITLKKAFEIIEEVRTKKYKAEIPARQIIILQFLGFPVWNITYLTSTFKILNFKIDAVSGKIVSEEVKSLFSFKK